MQQPVVATQLRNEWHAIARAPGDFPTFVDWTLRVACFESFPVGFLCLDFARDLAEYVKHDARVRANLEYRQRQKKYQPRLDWTQDMGICARALPGSGDLLSGPSLKFPMWLKRMVKAPWALRPDASPWIWVKLSPFKLERPTLPTLPAMSCMHRRHKLLLSRLLLNPGLSKDVWSKISRLAPRMSSCMRSSRSGNRCGIATSQTAAWLNGRTSFRLSMIALFRCWICTLTRLWKSFGFRRLGSCLPRKPLWYADGLQLT